MVDNHAYFQSPGDQSTSVLKKCENKPINWMHKPSELDVMQFVEQIQGYEKAAKKVRFKMITGWIEEETGSYKDPVMRLNSLQTSRNEGDIWPCYNCPSVG